MKKHRLEEMVDLLVERIEAKIDMYVKYLSVEQRPIFTQELKDEDLANAWDNLDVQNQLMADAEMRGGGAAMKELQNQAIKAQMKRPTIAEQIAATPLRGK
jgi:hypothetical protein